VANENYGLILDLKAALKYNEAYINQFRHAQTFDASVRV
jgi:hypothetical protein